MKLRRARTLRQLSLDDAARATKIRLARLSDLEGDVYTNFPNIAYAKGFLTSYGRYLGVDVRPYLEGFADTSTFGLDDYQYLSEKPISQYRAQRRPQRQRRHPGRVAAVVTTCAVLAVGLFLWALIVNVQRLGDLGKLADHQDARAHPSPRNSSVKPQGITAAPSPGAPQTTQPPAKAEKRPASNGGAAGQGIPELADFSFFFSPNGMTAPVAAKAPALPLPGDGSILREMTLGSSHAFFLAKADRTNAPASSREDRLNPLPSANRLGSRFYVHALGGRPVDAFEDEAQQAPVRVNNSLE